MALPSQGAQPFTPPPPTPVPGAGARLPYPRQPYAAPVQPVGYQSGYPYAAPYAYPYPAPYAYPPAMPMNAPAYWYQQ